MSKAFTKTPLQNGVRLVACTSQAQVIEASDHGEGFVGGSLSGFLKTVTLESPRIGVKLIDIGNADTPVSDTARQLCREIEIQNKFESVGYRGGNRYAQSLEACSLTAGLQGAAWRDKGVYVLAGGAGGIGLLVAKAIAADCRARIVLTGIGELSTDRLKAIESIKSTGSEVEYYIADATDVESMRGIIQKIKTRWGAINGVIQAGARIVG